MKNRKRFQKFMISAVALTTLVPFATRAGTAQATWNDRYYGLKPTYGQAKTPYQKASGAGIGITQEKGNGDKSAAWVYDEQSSGYLWPTKKVQGEPFGPNKNHFKTSKEGKSGRKWVVYTVHNNEAGKVGMLYKNALMYYPKGNKKAVKLDAKITWNGTYRYAKDKHWNYGIGKSNVNLHFDTTDFNVKEPYMGAANFTLTLYKAGTNTPYAVHAPVTQTDIDYNQGLIFKDPAYLMAVSGARLNTGTYANWNTSTPNKSKIFGDDGKSVYSYRTDKKTGKKLKVNQGSVYANQKEGWFTYLPKSKQSSFNLTFVHDYKTVPYGYNESYFKTPSTAKPKTYKVKHIKPGPDNMDTKGNYSDNGQADLFGFDFKKGTVTPYKVPIDKWVSKRKGNFKPDSKKNPLEINDKQHAFFDVHTALKTPSIAYVDSKNDDSDYNGLPLKSAIKTQDDPIIKKLVPDARKHKQRLVLRDYIDPRLKVVGAHVYSSSWGDKYGKNLKSTRAFKVGTGTATGKHKGYTVVDAVMTDHAAKASTNET